MNEIKEYTNKMPAFNIEFIIEYDEKYKEKELVKYINKRKIQLI